MKTSENIYKTIYDSATEGLIISNTKGIIEAVNLSIVNLFGYSQDELIGNTIDILIPKNVRADHHKNREKYYNNPTQRKMGAGRDLFGEHKNGLIIPLEISLNHFEIDNEKKILAMVTDITERKKIEHKIIQLNQELEERVEERTEKLNESEKLHRLIAQNFPKGTINVFDRNLNYIFVDGEELVKMNIDSKSLIGSNYIDRLPIEIKDDVKSKLTTALNGTATTCEIKTRGQYYVLNAVPLSIDSEQKTTRLLVVEKNITQEKIAELKTLESLERERQLNELKSRFVSMASHEFRTPLSTILSSASLTQKYLDNKDFEKTEKHINRIKSSVGLLTSILNDFLSLSKLEENKVELNYCETNIEELLSEIFDDISNTNQKDISLEYTHIGKKTCTTDPYFVKNISYNLISNAYKYTKSEIKCTSKIEQKMISISITDNGIGIPKDEQKNLFTRFFRAKNATNIQGTGLGLNIVKHYLDLLNGTITFESEKGMTTFNITIPTE